MNLQDILNYRDVCIHCERPLIMHIDRYPKLIIECHNNDLVIKSKNPGGLFFEFHPDGTFERSKRNYEIHKSPILIHKYCHFHCPLWGEYKGKTIDDIKHKSCYYGFDITMNNQGVYISEMVKETIDWHSDTEFWALDTFYDEQISYIYHGLFSKTIGDMLQLKLPIVNFSGAKTEEQYLNKMKLYALFS